MGDKTGIGWTEATWNPIVGCSIVSAGCTNCYAMKQAGRIERMSAGAGTQTHYAGTTKPSKAGDVWTGVMNRAPEHLRFQPLAWKRPRVIFVNSMSDLFHESVPQDWIDEAFAVMALSPQHTFQVLTKRAARMRYYLSHPGTGLRISGKIGRVSGEHKIPFDRMAEVACRWPLPNVWLGVSAEDQRAADERIPDLLETPAAIRFVSYEPAIGAIDFEKIAESRTREINSLGGWVTAQVDGDVVVGPTEKLDWIIIGGESHSLRTKAREFNVAWAMDTVRDCRAAGVAVFVKQLGSRPVYVGEAGKGDVAITHRKGETMSEWPLSIRVQQYPAGAR